MIEESTEFCNCRHESRLHTTSQGCLIANCRCREYRGRPYVVVLCGSTRFYDEFVRANYEETMKGHIVLSVGFFANASPKKFKVREHGELVGITPEQKSQLDELHKRKIDLADEVFILNVKGYIGESTAGELKYAQEKRKSIRFLEVPA
jgi:hypothetical protein